MFAQQVVADRRYIQVAEIQIHVRLAGIGTAHFRGGDQQVLYAAFFDQSRPVELRLDCGKSCSWSRRALDDPYLPANFISTTGNYLIFGNCGNRRATDRIQAERAIVILALADDQLGISGLADVLVNETEQFRFGNAGQQDRFRMLQYAYAGDDPARIHADQRNHRLAGICRNIDYIGRQENITDQTCFAIFHCISINVIWRALAYRELLC